MRRLAAYSAYGDLTTRATTELAERISVARADGGRVRVLHERRRRVDRDRRQDGPALLEPARRARAHDRHLAGAGLPRPRRLRHEHRRHGRLQGRRRAARRRHRSASPGTTPRRSRTRSTRSAPTASRRSSASRSSVRAVSCSRPTGYLQAVREICRERDVLFLADEVICGFGRVGDWFASSRFGLEPDLVTFAKAVTSGYVPLGGVIVGAARCGTPFWAEGVGPWRHGYTYSGHAVATAAAHANLDIIEREGLVARALELETELADGARAARRARARHRGARRARRRRRACRSIPPLLAEDPGAHRPRRPRRPGGTACSRACSSAAACRSPPRS